MCCVLGGGEYVELFPLISSPVGFWLESTQQFFHFHPTFSRFMVGEYQPKSTNLMRAKNVLQSPLAGTKHTSDRCPPSIPEQKSSRSLWEKSW